MFRRKSIFALAACAAGILFSADPVLAQTPLTTTRIVAPGSLSSPVGAVSIPGDDRVFFIERGGRVKIYRDGVGVQATPFANIASMVKSGGEQGLLGLAFSPDYASSREFFLHFSASNQVAGTNAGDTVIASMLADPSNPDVALPSSLRILLTVDQPYDNHNGGKIGFGSDGYLYIALGDGGSGGDPACNAQNLGSMLGKMHRIDVTSSPSGYSIPADNPFVSTPGAKPEIWAYGLRNPWQWFFDRETGDMYIGDVGQNAREEVTVNPAGAGGLNHGWKIMEGFNCFGTSACSSPPACNSPLLTLPITDYVNPSGFGGPCSVIGGPVYRGCVMPDLRGTYFFGDYCSNQLWTLRYDGSTVTGHTERTAELAPGGGLSINSIVAFAEDGDGEILIIELNGEVYRVVPNGPVTGMDCDSNGKIDSCELADNPDLDLSLDGVIDACQSLTLTGDLGTVSIASGGTQALGLDAGATHAGKIYLLLGSVTGTVPGLPVDSVVLPLNAVGDPYFLLTLTQPSLVLSGSVGALDGAGQSSAAWTIPGGVIAPGQVGLTFYHAYLAFGGTGGAELASNPIRVTLGS